MREIARRIRELLFGFGFCALGGCVAVAVGVLVRRIAVRLAVVLGIVVEVSIQKGITGRRITQAVVVHNMFRQRRQQCVVHIAVQECSSERMVIREASEEERESTAIYDGLRVSL